MQDLRSRSLLLGTLALLIVVGLILDELGALGPFEGLFLQLTTPLQRLVDNVVQGVVNTNETWRDLGQLRERNEQLESLVDELMIENVRLKEVEAQNEDLRRKLNFAETHPEYTLRAAEVRGRVIGSEPNNFRSALIIDVGRREGIRRGMPVVSERGLVGHVLTVGTNWAKVLLIVDPSSSVAALVQSSRAPGIVSGRLGQDLIMNYIPQEEQIAVGDVILTSGMGGNYPKAVVIGQVIEVEQHDIDTFQNATVRPSVDMSQLETVLVITTFESVDVQEALEQDDAGVLPETADDAYTRRRSNPGAMNTYLSFAILFSLALVQSTVTPNVKLLGVQPDLMLMVVVSWSLLRGSEEGMLWALIGGIMIDMFSTVPFGASTLALLITSFLSGLGHRNIFRLALLVPALVIPVATLLYQLILYGLLYAFGSRTNLMITLSRIVFPSMLVNTLGMPIVYLTARLLHRRTKREEIAL